jgi:hypothetical protein
MSDNNGKVILSLLAGATAGVVAGLLLAPEAGEATRSSLKKAATDFGGDLGKFFQDSLSKVRAAAGQDGPNDEAAVSEDRAAADELFNSMNSSGSASGDYGSGRSSIPNAQGDNAATAGI